MLLPRPSHLIVVFAAIVSLVPTRAVGQCDARTCLGECKDELTLCTRDALSNKIFDDQDCATSLATAVADCAATKTQATDDCSASFCSAQLATCLKATDLTFKACQSVAKAQDKLCKTVAKQRLADLKTSCKQDSAACSASCAPVFPTSTPGATLRTPTPTPQSTPFSGVLGDLVGDIVFKSVSTGGTRGGYRMTTLDLPVVDGIDLDDGLGVTIYKREDITSSYSQYRFVLIDPDFTGSCDFFAFNFVDGNTLSGIQRIMVRSNTDGHCGEFFGPEELAVTGVLDRFR